MSRFHVHLNVTDLAACVRFYSALFSTPPSVLKADYAKWMLDDPRVNFAISANGRRAGIDHLGVQAETAEEFAEKGRRLDHAGGTLAHEPGTVCCYAKSDKVWIDDPQGTRWETFLTLGEATTYHGDVTEVHDEKACGITAAAQAETASPAACCGSRQASCC